MGSIDSFPPEALVTKPAVVASESDIVRPAANGTSMATESDDVHVETVERIARMLSRYRMIPRDITPEQRHEADVRLRARILKQVREGQRLEMCLPAFPFKSPNTTDKVLGRVPDRAEEFALAHLNGMCAAVGDVYPPGARLLIISDGLVYNDLLSVPDRDVWAYGEQLRKLCAEMGFGNIAFARLNDLVQLQIPQELDEIRYISHATDFRRALLSTYGDESFDVDATIKADDDTRLTYCGYIKFLETDLKHVYPVGEGRSKAQFKKGVGYIAKKMLSRGDAFARAIAARFPDHLRLSIHPSTGGKKFSLYALPTDTAFTTPWHCAIAFHLDGTITTGHRATFEEDTKFELVYNNGKPSHFREKSELYPDPERFTCSPVYPSGLIVRPASGHGTMGMDSLEGPKLRKLSELNSPIVLRGFRGTTDREAWMAKANDFGEPLTWNGKFGFVLEVKDRQGDLRGLNSTLTSESMPFHYDGVFKVVKKVNDKGEEEDFIDAPRFQWFVAKSPSPPNTGFTLFASSAVFFKHLPAEYTVERLRKMTWGFRNIGWDATLSSPVLLSMPLIIDHPTTGLPCLRYHEPWPQSKTKYRPSEVVIEGDGEREFSPEESKALCALFDEILYDRRVCLYHSWEQGDLAVADNTLMMHTRTDLPAGCDRELWRMHLD